MTLWLAFCLAPALSSVEGQEAVDLAELAKMADDYGLPAPPKTATLVLANTGWTTVLSNRSSSDDPGLYRPAFLIETLPDRQARVFWGWTEEEVSGDAGHRPATRPYSLEVQEKKPKGYLLRAADMPSAVTAVQLARRGDLDGAKKLWDAMNSEGFFQDGNALEGVGRLKNDPRLFFARCVYQFIWDDTLRHDADLKSLDQRLAKLRRDYSVLFGEGWYEKRRVSFADDLHKTAIAEKAADGSVEALLVAWGQRGGDAPTSDASARLILLLGPKALPELKRLATDTRLTRKVDPAIMKKPEDRVRLGQLATDLIKAIGDAPADADDKESYETSAVELKDGKIEGFRKEALWFLGQKYPRSLVALCGRLPADLAPKTWIHPLTGAILESNLKPEEKAEVVEALCVRLQDDWRIRIALQDFAKLNPKRCAELLKPQIARLPADVDEPYWTCQEAAFSHVVMRLEDDEVWEDFLKAAKKASIGLRMQMMNPMNYGYIGDKNRTRRLKFLAAFLDDAEVRDVSKAPKKFEGPHAGFRNDVMSVRDFAAETIGGTLKIRGPNELGTAEEWTAYRAKIREALANEGIR
ncbi:MAG TPA: hypothetical protein VF950_12535 [Planctomycetota bacterium]